MMGPRIGILTKLYVGKRFRRDERDGCFEHAFTCDEVDKFIRRDEFMNDFDEIVSRGFFVTRRTRQEYLLEKPLVENSRLTSQ